MSLPLTSEERQRYEWQLWTPGFGEEGQQKLKAATVLISRCGGVGGTVALELAAAGVAELGIRPEDIRIVAADAPGAVPGEVYVVEPMGSETFVDVMVGGERLSAR